MSKIDLPQDEASIMAVLIDRINQHTKLLHEHEETLKSIIDTNKEQSERLMEIRDDTKQMVNLFHVGEGTATTIKWIGRMIVQLGAIIAALGGIYYAAITYFGSK